MIESRRGAKQLPQVSNSPILPLPFIIIQSFFRLQIAVVVTPEPCAAPGAEARPAQRHKRALLLMAMMTAAPQFPPVKQAGSDRIELPQ
jgi:hypothetical protein